MEASLRDVWAPDIVFYEIPEAADTGVFRGADAFAAHVRGLLELGGHFQIELRSIEGRGAYVLAAWSRTSRGEPAALRWQGAPFIWRGGREAGFASSTASSTLTRRGVSTSSSRPPATDRASGRRSHVQPAIRAQHYLDRIRRDS